jgi:hypothetical protein
LEFGAAITYTEAITKCEEVGGFILEPFNEITMNDTQTVLKNFTTSETKFWIGERQENYIILIHNS